MNRILISLLTLLSLVACNSDYTVKPRGYFRIALPKKEYRRFDRPGYPYTFEYPVYGEVLQDSLFFEDRAENPYWINIDFPQFGGRIHISYKEIGRRNKFDSLIADAYEMSYKQHTYKASAIDRKPFTTPNGIEGVFISLRGNTATATQFFVTDSTKHFLRGALYFATTPNEDSLKPVNDFLRKDVEHLINTLQWR
ncbi:gliding motility lipoprotein GldD [Flaviaesturariibacter terrae]